MAPSPPRDGMPSIAVLSRDPMPGPVREGGKARRAGLLASLRNAQVHHLAISCRGSSDTLEGRLVPYFLALRQALAVAAHTDAPRLLLFYPELPGLHPARAFKLPLIFAWLLVLRWICTARGIRLQVDVGDIPRWQHPSLGLPLSMWPVLHRLVERLLFGLADRVTCATSTLADDLARDLGLPRDRFAVVPNAAHPPADPRPPRPPGRRRFIYVGGLSRARGIETLCREFVTKAPPDAELVVIGEGGDWIEGEFPRVRVSPPQPEEDCAREVAASDFALIPYPTTGYFRTVAPMKLPLYALARTPIISTELEASKHLIRDRALGECRAIEDFFGDVADLEKRYAGFTGGTDLESFEWPASAAALLEA